MSGNNTSQSGDDSSGNLAAADTTPDLTIDHQKPAHHDPDDTFQDPLALQNAWPDPLAERSDLHNQMDPADLFSLDPLTDESISLSDAASAGSSGKSPSSFQSKQKVSDSTAANITTPANEIDDIPDAVSANESMRLFHGRFEILGTLGAGGMGIVYKAKNLALNRIEAIKVFQDSGKDSAARLQRFQQEAEALAHLNHENIVRVYDLLSTATGEPYIHFEFVEGCSLSDLLGELKEAGEILPVETVLDIMMQSLSALDYMHKNKIIHRDVKPSNIMLRTKSASRKKIDSSVEVDKQPAERHADSGSDFSVKLVDFGLAKIRDDDDNTKQKITRAGQAVGTANYMSPEQCFGEKVDGRGDIYSLGCVLFEMLTGHVPFHGGDAAKTMYLHRDADVPPIGSERPDLPYLPYQLDFERIVNKMLAKKKEDRYQKAEIVRTDLKQLYIGIKGGAAMEAPREKGNTPMDIQSSKVEAVPQKPGPTFEELRKLPTEFQPTVQDLHEIQTSHKQSEASFGNSQAGPQKVDRKVFVDPLADDGTQQDAANSQQTEQDIDGVQPLPVTNSDPMAGANSHKAPDPPSQKAKGKPVGSGRNFNEGDLFGHKYEIKGHIGQGGMGIVYKATDVVLGRLVAIKFLKAKSGISHLEMQRFQQEAKAIASLNHENIIRVHDMSVTQDGDPFFVLEYLEGDSLSDLLRGKKTLPLDRAIAIICEVCDALEHAHSHGVIHRDLKPSNLMLVPNARGGETIKLLDFGIAKLNPVDEETILKLTKTGELFGSPHYMSPEQCSGKSVDAPSDIYSLGCVLYEMLCGGPPFSGANALDTLDKHKNAQLPSVATKRTDLPEAKAIDQLLARMMAKEPAERYQSPAEVRTALKEISKKLSGSPLTRVLKRVFPNGLSDSEGRKNAALLLLSLASSTVVIAFVFYKVNSIAVSSPAVPIVADKTPWQTSDLNGQKMFDQGAYDEAEKFYQQALRKAQSESGKKQLIHMNTSLRELRTLYSATGDKQKFDWTNRQLLDWSLPSGSSVAYDWDDVLAKADSAVKTNDSSKLAIIVELARELAVNGNESSRQKNTRAMLSLLSTKLRGIQDSTIANDELIVLDTGVSYRESLPLPPDCKRAISDLLKVNPEKLQPNMVYPLAKAAIHLGMKPTAYEHLLEYLLNRGNSSEKLHARLALSKILWETGRRAGARDSMIICLKEAEAQLPRNFFVLLQVLDAIATTQIEDRKPATAIPMLLRCKVISECEPITNFDGRVATDAIMAKLSEAYADSYRFEDAEEILRALVNSSERTDGRDSLQRANWLGKLGKIYLISKKFGKAKVCLVEAIRIFETKDSLSKFYSKAYDNALSNVKFVDSETAKSRTSFPGTAE